MTVRQIRDLFVTQRTNDLRKDLADAGIRVPDRRPPLELSVVLNFDDVADGTIIDTQHSGVTLAAIKPGQTAKGHVYARKSWDKNNSTNVMSVQPPDIGLATFDDGTGWIEVSFASAVKSVAVDALALAWQDLRPVTAKPYLEAYDANGNKLARVIYPASFGEPNWGTWLRLQYVASGAPIARVLIGSERLSNSSPVYGLFDQLSFPMILRP